MRILPIGSRRPSNSINLLFTHRRVKTARTASIQRVDVRLFRFRTKRPSNIRCTIKTPGFRGGFYTYIYMWMQIYIYIYVRKCAFLSNRRFPHATSAIVPDKTSSFPSQYPIRVLEIPLPTRTRIYTCKLSLLIQNDNLIGVAKMRLCSDIRHAIHSAFPSQYYKWLYHISTYRPPRYCWKINYNKKSTDVKF